MNVFIEKNVNLWEVVIWDKDSYGSLLNLSFFIHFLCFIDVYKRLCDKVKQC